ncbi:MAG: hypothetical protein WKF78_05635 [Candidatus Limnocylindrales bacterium]
MRALSLLGTISSVLVVALVLIREGRVLTDDIDRPTVQPLDGVIVALTVAVASVVLERALSILL